MGCFQVKYDSRVVIYERKLFIRLATGQKLIFGYSLWRIAAIRISANQPTTNYRGERERETKSSLKAIKEKNVLITFCQ